MIKRFLTKLAVKYLDVVSLDFVRQQDELYFKTLDEIHNEHNEKIKRHEKYKRCTDSLISELEKRSELTQERHELQNKLFNAKRDLSSAARKVGRLQALVDNKEKRIELLYRVYNQMILRREQRIQNQSEIIETLRNKIECMEKYCFVSQCNQDGK